MSKRTGMMDQLMCYLEKHEITEYSTLMDALADGGDETARLYEFCCDEVVLVVSYLDSRRRCRGLVPEFESGDFLSV